MNRQTVVQLVPMAQSAFEAYLEGAIQEYAREHAKSGTWTEADSLAESRTEFTALLPNGVSSRDQFLFSIIDETTKANVGMIWFAVKSGPRGKYAFIYDFNVFPEFQGKGYGAAALRALEEQVKKQNLSEIELHVFGHNHTARALYNKLGYAETNIRMVKKLD